MNDDFFGFFSTKAKTAELLSKVVSVKNDVKALYVARIVLQTIADWNDSHIDG